MARQANASYEGNGQRRSLSAEEALKKIAQLESQLAGIQTEIDSLKLSFANTTSTIDDIKRIKMPQGIDAKTFSSLSELWQHYEQNSDAGAQQYFNRFKIDGSWSPVTGWIRAWISAQNRVGNGKWDITGSIVGVTGKNNDIYIARVTGGINGYSDLTASWTKLQGPPM